MFYFVLLKELPEDKRAETTYGKPMYAHMFPRKPAASVPPVQVPRPSSRHKRHADNMAPNKLPSSLERKPRKRRTLERVGASVVSVYFVYIVTQIILNRIHYFFIS